MDSKTPKQKLECATKTEGPEGNREKERKRLRTDDNDEVDEFFALVERIKAMTKLFKQKGINCSSMAEISTAGGIGGNTIRSKSSWKPSLEWEDFVSLAEGKSRSTSIGFISSTIQDASSSEVTQKTGTDKNMDVKSFDLNVEAPLEHPLPSAT